MAIKTNYNFKGIKVPEVTIRVIRIFGSSKEGFNSLVGVYTTTKETIQAVEEVTEQRLATEATDEVEAVYETVVITEAKEAYEVTKDELLEEFNFQVPFNKDERGYETIYKALTAKYGGEQV